MTNSRFKKELTLTDLGLTKSHLGGGFTTPSKEIKPSDFFVSGYPNYYKFHDKRLNQDFTFYVKQNGHIKNNEVRLSKMTNYFKLKKSEVGDFVEIFKEFDEESGSLLYFIDVVSSKDSTKDLKDQFADWFIKQDTRYFKNLFKSNRETFIQKISQYEIAYKNDFGISIFSLKGQTLEQILEALYKNEIVEPTEMFTLSSKLGNHAPKAILGKKNYIKFIEELLDRNEKRIFVENISLRQFALDVFVFSCKEFGEEFLKKHLTDTNMGNIDGKNYRAIRFPKYFSNTNMLAIFDEKQDKKSLTTGKSQRYSEENIKILGEDYIYFNFQWSQPENSSSADFFELKKFIEDWTNQRYNLIYLEVEGKINYRLVLKSQIEQEIDFKISSFQKSCEDSGIIFNEQLVTRFISSLTTKPFVILTGLSGSGKTKLAQAFAMWMSESKDQYAIVPVGADWTNREPLLGYPNSLKKRHYVKPDSGVLDILLRANDNYKMNNENLSLCKPYFLILDEMNLSHVERYFADFLSAMESGDEIKLYSGEDRSWEVDESKNKEGDFLANYKVDQQVKMPKNLFIIGTVNIDETTYMFSPKVLDRANTIEFRISKLQMEIFFKDHKALDMNQLLEDIKINKGKGAESANEFIRLAKGEKISFDSKKHQTTFVQFFQQLQQVGSEFGYRTVNEMTALISYLNHFSVSKNDAYDIAIMQKLLPKLNGSRSKLSKILPQLGGLCLVSGKQEDAEKLFEEYKNNQEVIITRAKEVNFSLSFEKLCRMYKNAQDNGFASYAEA